MGGEPTPPARPVGDVVVGTPAFVAAKIATPEVGPASVRPDVLDKLRAGGRKRLLLVRAPAGYGKTAVVSEASRRLGWRSVWYKLDVLDHDPAVLVASLVQGIRQLVADFGGILMERFANAHEAPMTQAEMVALLAAELQDEVDGPLHLVLDDYHEAVGSSGLNETLDHLVASLPGHIHIVLLTRCRPAMATSRLKLDGQLIEIGFDDLRLDAAQLADVLFERTGLRVSPDQAARLVRLTEGWPASVVLIGRALDWSDLDSIEAALTDPRITSDIFSYLSEEAVRHEDAEAATFMTATCCLDSMTVDLANQVARTDEAARLLDGLVGRNAFTFLDLSSGTYRYHQLFRDYLRHRFIQEHGKAAFHELQLWTAEAVETAGDRETAVELCFAANEPGAALAVVSRSGELITDNCRLETLDAWLERLPRYLRDHDPWGLFLQAQRSLREGSGEEALEALDRARALFEGSGDRWGAYHTLSSMEAIHFWKGAFEQAAAYCEKALAVAETPLQRMHTTVSLGSA
ncbi:MAG TPA: hypothetical protein VK576_10220, partial [Thermoleophilia bacterium]|nr:hypothetical protein [Thermoleophilia bacterium]